MTARPGSSVGAIVGLVATLLTLSLLFSPAPKAQEPLKPSPLIYAVRSDLFAGLRGDMTRLERGMKACEATLATEPNHPEALVWHGAGLAYLAGQALRRQELIRARDLLERGITEMDRAVAIAPDSMFVVIPRASAFSAVSVSLPDRVRARKLLQAAVEGFEQAFAVERPRFDHLSVHRRGELLAGLAESWWRLGDTEKARGYLERIVAELPDSPYQARARAWLEDGPETGRLSCLTCHHEKK